MSVGKVFGIECNTSHHVLTGLSNDDHAQYLLTNGNRTLAGNLLPEMTGASGAVSTRNIGSAAAKFNEVYCHDLRADSGSIYVNDKKVIEDVSDTITISTDTNQRLMMKTTGSAGDTYVQGQGGITFEVPATYSSKNINITNLSTNGTISIGGSGQTVNLVGTIGLASATMDHGALTGLSDDDHTQYVLATGSRAFSAVVGGVTPTLTAHLATKGYVDSMIQGLDWQASVKDMDLGAPPVGPTTGDRYLISTSASGTWSGHDGDITQYNGATWDYTVKNEGMAVWVEDINELYTYNGSAWVQFGSTVHHGALTGLGDDDHTQYHTDARGDIRYYTKSQTDTISGTIVSQIVTDHGALGGLGDDDHTQYLNNTRGDARYSLLNRELVPAPTSDHEYSGDISTMQVDVNGVGFGAALHLDTDGNWIEATASGASTVPCLSLALETGTGSKKVFLKGFIRDDTWNWTVGDPIYVGVTAGTLTQTIPSATGQQVQIVGYATHADRMFFNPSYTIIELT